MAERQGIEDVLYKFLKSDTYTSRILRNMRGVSSHLKWGRRVVTLFDQLDKHKDGALDILRNQKTALSDAVFW